ncbi:hypothetical protein SLEP1_g4456 [Rubroshorea leprosula]|uniref:Uncharacterized protein n=1 Tax=Rubroshorea leprosula TaxID=152421 RepID=A0AAV5HUJ2_9ROSI|nr:hypothetical protein SLEP1_g4456 [Rubroshorea leprosula]
MFVLGGEGIHVHVLSVAYNYVNTSAGHCMRKITAGCPEGNSSTLHSSAAVLEDFEFEGSIRAAPLHKVRIFYIVLDVNTRIGVAQPLHLTVYKIEI